MDLAGHYWRSGKKMRTTQSPDRTRNLFAYACGGITILVILLIMHRDYPFVGHDYAYFIPRLIDTNLHILVNGFTIQWYTPSFGGGLPGFPNPQHMQYSIVQLLSLFLNPWMAVLTSTTVISAIGYYFFYKFLNQNLELNWMASTLGAMFFIGNGFYIEHLIAGHLGYQLFPLVGIILYVLTDRGERYLFTSTVIAVIMSMMIHQAGFYLIVILILSIAMMLCLLSVYKPPVVNLRKLGWVAVLSSILTLAMTASKVYAAMAFMRHFPREVFDNYNTGIIQGIVGMIMQLFGVMSVVPVLNLTQNNPGIVTGILSDLTGAEYGIWETDIGLSPVLIFFLFVGIANTILSIRRKDVAKLGRSQLFGVALLALAIWITVEFTLAKGPIYSFTKELPILRSLHVNVRFAAAFICPLTIVGAFQMHHFFLRDSKPIYFMLAVLVTLLSLFSYFSLSAAIHIREYDVEIANRDHTDIQNGTRLPVESIAEIDVWRGFSADASSIKPYEPIFGYKLEKFAPQIHLGKILEADDGYFNMTNPASLVFPELNDLQPFERFKVSEQDQLETFLERRQPDWALPAAQKVLNVVSATGLVLTLAILLWGNIHPNKN
jgi:hypothetical protein